MVTPPKKKTPARAPAGAGKALSSPVPGRMLRSAVGKALVSGGRALIDPRVAVGEMAVRLGEGLLAGDDRLQWFVVRLDDEGRAHTFGFVDRNDAQVFFDGTLQAFPRQYLCKCVAGPVD